MNDWIQLIIAVVCAIVASGGFWSFVLHKYEKKDAKSKLILGLAHDRIIHLGMHYINQGCITHDEYENLVKYLYEPYKEMGGNGGAQKIMSEVEELPIVKNRRDTTHE